MSATLVRSRKDAASSKGNTTALRPAKTTAAMAASTGYTMADVAKHDKEGDAWVTVADKVCVTSQWTPTLLDS